VLERIQSTPREREGRMGSGRKGMRGSDGLIVALFD
jgi:hypothetical protein